MLPRRRHVSGEGCIDHGNEPLGANVRGGSYGTRSAHEDNRDEVGVVAAEDGKTRRAT